MVFAIPLVTFSQVFNVFSSQKNNNYFKMVVKVHFLKNSKGGLLSRFLLHKKNEFHRKCDTHLLQQMKYKMK